MKPQRVLLVGADLGVRDYTDQCLVRGFQQLGCEVHSFDYRASALMPSLLRRWIPESWRHRWSPRNVPLIESIDRSLSNERFLSCVTALQPDLVIAMQAERLRLDSVMAAKAAGTVIINWILDEPQDRVPPEVVPAYDLWVVWDRTVSDWLMRQGARRVEHLPVGCDPELHKPAVLSAAGRHRWASSICFVGGYTPDRETKLAAVTDLGLAIWGTGWEWASDPSVRRCIREARRLEREEWLKAYTAAGIVVNLHSQGQEGLNLRVWEALAVGTCLISDYRADLDRSLPGLVGTFRDAAQMRRLCQTLLADPERRLAMAQQGRDHVVAYHTFAHRARILLDWAAECRVVR